MTSRRLVLPGAAATALAAAALVVPAAQGTTTGRAASTAGDSAGDACAVHVMRTPRGADDGTVMDIEQVAGLGTVYYGSYEVRNREGRKVRRAVVWRGLDARPTRVGPRTPDTHIAFELTASGLVNGQSEVGPRRRERGWVQDLATGRLTWADATPGARRSSGLYFRRINDRGNAAGTLTLADDRLVPAFWRRADRDPRLLPAGPQRFGEGWAVNNRRDVVGAYARPLPEELGYPEGAAYPQGVVWHPDGTRTRLAGLGFDTYPRLLNDAGNAAGVLWYGDYDTGHGETGFWRTPGDVEALGLLPGGGFSGAYGLSAGGWAVGVADRFDPENPLASEMGTVDHSFLWTGEEGAVRVLPSPKAVEEGTTDWREWYGGAAHAVHTGLDQVGSSGHVGEKRNGSIRYLPTVWENASTCGELVETTHTAFWEEELAGARAARATPPPAYDHAAVRERLTGPRG